MVPFLDDGAGYLDWLTTHPDGFVLNTYRNPTPGYLMLHHADLSASACRIELDQGLPENLRHPARTRNIRLQRHR